MGVLLLLLFLAPYSALVFPVDAFTEPNDVTALQTILNNWKDTLSANWSGTDPCSSSWTGVRCTNGSVTGLNLAGRGLAGPIPASIGNLSSLTTLILSGNRLTGHLPSNINQLYNLHQLSLDQNFLVGPLPDLSNLTFLTRLYVQNNNINGSISSSIGLLSSLQTLFLSNNEFSGPLPPIFGNLSLLTTLYLNGNSLTGTLPDFSALRSMQYLRLHDNQFTGSIPSEIGNLPSLQNLGMENNHFTGAIPDTFNQLSSIPYLDLSNNLFVLGRIPAWLLNMQGLPMLNLVNCGLSGSFPSLLHSLQSMTSANFNLNQFSGTLNVSSINENLETLSLEDNDISGLYGTVPGSLSVMLGGNPMCENVTLSENVTFFQPNVCDRLSGNGPRTWRQHLSCTKVNCQNAQSPTPQNCSCTYPFISKILLISPSFSTFNAPRIVGLEYQLAVLLRVTLNRVWLQSANVTSSNQTLVDVLVFPDQSGFWHDSEISFIKEQLRNTKALSGYGQYQIQMLSSPQGNVVKPHSNTLSIVLGVILPVVMISIATLIAVFLWKRHRNKAFMLRYGVHQELAKNSLQPMFFTYQDIKMMTNDFSESNMLGKGGFGEVFRGIFPDGTKVAVKRLYTSQSLQGTHEFINEVTIIVGVLHRNLVKLIGCCIEETERMLIYEFVENNSLYHILFGSSDAPVLDWPCRYDIAIGTARGLAYLHDDCETRIIHRDIKASNILVDKKFQPKIADFGLARLFPDGATHVTTRVAGTFGYVAPEYGLYGQLTEKADVFSYGVVLLELICGKKCVDFGEECILLLEWAWKLYEENRSLELVDPRLTSTLNEKEAERAIHVAFLCTQAAATRRPTMPHVVAMLIGEKDIVDVPTIPGAISELLIGNLGSSSQVEANTKDYD